MEVSLSTLRSKLLIIWLSSLFLVIATTLIISRLYPDGDYDKKRGDFELRNDNIEALVMGVSHARAIHFPSLGFSGFSYHDPNSDLKTVAEKYRAIAPLMPNLKYLLLPIGPAFFYQNLTAEERSVRQSAYYSNYPKLKTFGDPLYWSLLFSRPEYKLQQFRKNLREAIKTSTFKPANLNKKPSCYPVKPDNQGHEDGFIGGYFDVYAAGGCLDKLAISTIKAHLRRTLNTRNPQDNFQRNKKIITAMIRELAANEHQLILFVPPFTAEYYEHINWAEAKQNQLGYLKELSAQPNVLFVDYHDLFYQRNYIDLNTLFYDDDHLGLNGAREFSKILGEDIRKFERLLH